MSERDVDAELVDRVQRGDKHAFDLLVLKYQRKIMRLLSRMVRDPKPKMVKLLVKSTT